MKPRFPKASLYRIMTEEKAKADVIFYAEEQKTCNSQVHESFDGEVYLIDFYCSKTKDEIDEYLKKVLGEKFHVRPSKNYTYILTKTES